MSNYDEDRNPSVLEMFEKAMNRFHHKAHDHKAQFSPVFLPSFRPDGDQEINGLQTVLTVIFSHSHPELFDIALKINTKGPLIKNLMNAVVSSVYRNKQKSELFGSNILRTLEVGSLADINIITTGTT
ncbi:hypothetical protein NEOLI_003156 [Neolecta irregularis DAH-3]|uniref:Uncharacterized protein n=1 Tax=Neolecta irregularis (strain DAH-3) TaxID=1198029 RepID=A0A1U7LJH2_NEOID|nr:hypothetical protein NEOLI_003156 [Neolecta irregularis DAH-3]|eukprot:OLL22805.1 hypothetical protein NEOLI_003156 [Neolecta irregularis DAH-3]